MQQPTTRGAFALAAVLATLASAPTANAQAGKGKTPERTVYVPIDEFDKVFDREQGGVFVPYQELLRLLERANARPTPPPVDATTPPAEFVLVGAKLEGTAGERVVQFTATFDIEVLEADRWVIVPIGLGEASLEEVKAGDKRAVVGPMSQLVAQLNQQPQPPGARRPALPAHGYGVILKGAGRIQTTARFAVPIASKPGQSSFRLTLPSAALSNFEVTLPQAGLGVNVDNALATEEQAIQGQDQTRVRAYFGAAASAVVTWNPRPKQVAGETRQPLLFADTETSLRLDEGVLQTTTRIAYRILQAPCGEFRVQFPKGYTLLSVRGENMSALPTPEAGNDAQTIVVRLHDKVQDAYALELRLERVLGDGTSEIEVPRVVTLGTERESGLLAARASEFLTLEPMAGLTGVSQIDAGGLTQTLASDLRWGPGQPRPPLAFRYLRQPWALKLKATRVEPEVDGKVFTHAVVKDDEVAVATTVRYTIKKRGIFGVRLRLPQGFQVLDCGDERTVKDHRAVPATEDEKKQGLGDILVVDFQNQANPGPFALPIIGTVKRTPMGPEAAKEVVALPRLGLLDVAKETGVLGIAAMSHLELQAEHQGVVPRGVRDLGGLGFPYGAGQGEDLVYAFSYGRPDGVAVKLNVKKREPKVTAKVESLVDAQEDLVRVETVVNYLVEYAGVEQVRLEVPAALNTEQAFKIEGDLVKDRRCEVKDKTAIWTVTLQGKRTGAFAIKTLYDIKLDDFKAGQQKDVALHELKVLDCFSETGDIAIKKHENLVIADVEREAIERRDQRELPDALKSRGAIQAFRYVSHPNKLVLRATKYNFQAPLGILVTHLHQDEVVVEEDGTLKVEAFLLLQNNAEQLLTVALPAGAEMRGLEVMGQTREWSPIDGAQPTIQVQLGDAPRDVPFPVRLRFDIPRQGKLGTLGALELFTVRFPLKDDKFVPVARLTRRLYLPQGYAWLDFDTDATKLFDDSTLWEDLKTSLGVRVVRVAPGTGREAVDAAVDGLRNQFPLGANRENYTPLVLPSDGPPRTFEKLDSPSRLKVRYATWPVFFFLDVLCLVGVIALGAVVEAKQLARPLVFVGASAAVALLGATFLGRAWEPFLASALVGSAGLGAFYVLRGGWREVTVERHKRRMAELAEEAQVAKARAQAAEAEAKLRPAGAAAPAPGPTPKGGSPAGDQAAADRIRFEGGSAPQS